MDFTEKLRSVPKFPERLPEGHARFFSGRELDSVRRHYDPSTGTISYGRLFVRARDGAEISLNASARYTFWQEEKALREGIPFSEKVVVSGIVPKDQIRIVGGMNDEVECIDGPVKIDHVYLISGTWESPVLEDITEQVIQSKKSTD